MRLKLQAKLQLKKGRCILRTHADIIMTQFSQEK